MDLMVYDGIVEKVFIGNQEDRAKRIAAGTNGAANGVNGNGKKSSKNGKDKKGKRKKVEASSDEDEESESESDEDDSRKKKKKKGKKSTVKRSKNGKAKKKRSKREESEEEDSDESSESEFDEDAPAKTSSKKKKKGRGGDSDDEDEEMRSEDDEDDDESDAGGKRKKKKGSSSRKKKDRSKKNLKALASDEEDSDDDPLKNDSDDDVKPKLPEHALGDEDQNLNDYVYRIVRPYTPIIGWTDMPCGKCPVEEFCSEPLRQRAGIVKKPTTVSDSYGFDSLALGGGGGPRLKIELEGGIQGVGMLGGAGAAVGVSLAKWGEMKGQVGKGVAPVNPRDCVYFKDWLTADADHEE
jgi:DNA-directed RNA polymerase III subunit RPC6